MLDVQPSMHVASHLDASSHCTTRIAKGIKLHLQHLDFPSSTGMWRLLQSLLLWRLENLPTASRVSFAFSHSLQLFPLLRGSSWCSDMDFEPSLYRDERNQLILFSCYRNSMLLSSNSPSLNLLKFNLVFLGQCYQNHAVFGSAFI